MQCLSYYGLELEVYLPLEPQRETCLYITARLLARFLFLVCIVLKLGLHIWNDGILPLCLLFFFCSVCEYAKQKCAYTQLAPSIFYISGFIVQYVKKKFTYTWCCLMRNLCCLSSFTTCKGVYCHVVIVVAKLLF